MQANRKHRRSRKVATRLTVVGLLLMALVVTPRILFWSPVLSSLVARYGDLEPLRVEIDQSGAGWFAPMYVRGLRVYSQSDELICSIDQVTTEKGLWHWVTHREDLGKVELSGVTSLVRVADGQSNIEAALQPLLERWAEESTAEPAVERGEIRVTNGRILVTDATQSEIWAVVVDDLVYRLPSPDVAAGVLEAEIAVAPLPTKSRDETRTSSDRPAGTLVAEVRPERNGRITFRAKAAHLPLEFCKFVRQRIPEFPVEQLSGRLSAAMAGWISEQEGFRLALSDVVLENLYCAASQWLGNDAIRLQRTSASAQVQGTSEGIWVKNGKFLCDFAEVTVSGYAPAIALSDFANADLIASCQLEASGTLDVPKLAKAAPALVPLRQGLELKEGTVDFQLGIVSAPQRSPELLVRLAIGELEGSLAGQQLRWDKPLSVAISAQSDPKDQYRLQARVLAEFGELTLSGTAASGTATLNADLDRLHSRVQSWFEIPVERFSGTLQSTASWSAQQASEKDTLLLDVEVKLQSSALQIVTAAGRTIQEPAWNGTLTVSAELANQTLAVIQSVALHADANDEKFSFELTEPINLLPTAETSGQEGAFQIDLHSRLERLRHRVASFMPTSPELELSGRVDLATSGRLRLDGVVVETANWNCEELVCRVGAMSFAEPQMIGRFSGHLDTANPGALQVDSLQVQSSSLSLAAKDAADTQSPGTRNGRGRFRADLARLFSNAGLAPDGYQLHGQVEGDIAWRLTRQGASLNLFVEGNEIRVLGEAASDGHRFTWHEPSVQLAATGNIVFDSGAMIMSPFKLTLPWGKLEGQLQRKTGDASIQLAFDGTAEYDLAAISQKLGGMSQYAVWFQGKHLSPVTATIAFAEDQEASLLRGLSLRSNLGWETANILGADVGPAEVPIEIEQGVMSCRAEIPVSGGTVRCDISGDLAQTPLRLTQSSQRVMENVTLTEAMTSSWLKYIAPLMADATRIEGRITLDLRHAEIVPGFPQLHRVDGVLSVYDASVGPGPLANQFIAIYRQIEAVRKQQLLPSLAQQQRTVWVELPSQEVEFNMKDGHVYHQGFQARIGDLAMSTEGSIDVAGNLNLQLVIPVPDKWIGATGLFSGMRGQVMRFAIGGTLSQPSIDIRQFAELGRQSLRSAAAGALQQGLQRGLGKLFGEEGSLPQSDNGNAGNATPTESSANPLKQLGNQLLNTPSLLQGILPGLNGDTEQQPSQSGNQP